MPLLKRFIITHQTDGFIAAIYAERYERAAQANSFTGNRCGNFFVGAEIVASVDNPRVTIGISGVKDSSRPLEDQGKFLSLELCEQLAAENLAIQTM